MTTSQHTIAGTVTHDAGADPQGTPAHGDVLGRRRRRSAAGRLQRPAGLPIPARARVVVLMLMHYVDGDLGQYHEFGTNVMVNPPVRTRAGRARCSRPAPSSTTCPSTRPSRWRRAGRFGVTRRSWRTSRFGRPSVRLRLQRRRATGDRHGLSPRPADSAHLATAGAAHLLAPRRGHPRDRLRAHAARCAADSAEYASGSAITPTRKSWHRWVFRSARCCPALLTRSR